MFVTIRQLTAACVRIELDWVPDMLPSLADLIRDLVADAKQAGVDCQIGYVEGDRDMYVTVGGVPTWEQGDVGEPLLLLTRCLSRGLDEAEVSNEVAWLTEAYWDRYKGVEAA
jgi:hypothetical protein